MSLSGESPEPSTGIRRVASEMPAARSVQNAMWYGRVISTCGGALSFIVSKSTTVVNKVIIDPVLFCAYNFQSLSDGLSVALGQGIVDEEDFDEGLATVLLPSEIREISLSKYAPSGKRAIQIHKAFGHFQTICTLRQEDLSHLSATDQSTVRKTQALALGGATTAFCLGYGLLLGAPVVGVLVLGAGASRLRSDKTHSELVLERFTVAIQDKIDADNEDVYPLSSFFKDYIGELGPQEAAIVASIMDRTAGAAVKDLKNTLLKAIKKTLDTKKPRIVDLFDQLRQERLQIVYKLLLRKLKVDHIANKAGDMVTAMIYAQMLVFGTPYAAKQLGLAKDTSWFSTVLEPKNLLGNLIKGVIDEPCIDTKIVLGATAALSTASIGLLLKHGLTAKEIINQVKRLNLEGKEGIETARRSLDHVKLAGEILGYHALPSRAEGGAAGGAGADPAEVDREESTNLTFQFLTMVSEAFTGDDWLADSSPTSLWVQEKLIQSSGNIMKVLMNISAGLGGEFLASAAKIGGASSEDASFLMQVPNIIEALKSSASTSSDLKTEETKPLFELEDLESLQEKSSTLMRAVAKSFVRALHQDMCERIDAARINVAAAFQGVGVGADKIAKEASRHMDADADAVELFGPFVAECTGSTFAGQIAGTLATGALGIVSFPSRMGAAFLAGRMAPAAEEAAAAIAPQVNGEAIASEEALIFLTRAIKYGVEDEILPPSDAQDRLNTIAGTVPAFDKALLVQAALFFDQNRVESLDQIIGLINETEPERIHIQMRNILAHIVHHAFYNREGSDADLRIRREHLNALMQKVFLFLERINPSRAETIDPEFAKQFRADLYLIIDAALIATTSSRMTYIVELMEEG